MPSVVIPDLLYQRLQSIAVPLEDTMITVIEKLFDFYSQNNQNNSKILEYHDFNESRLKINPNNPDCLKFTKVLQAFLDQEEIFNPNWNLILHSAFKLALKKGVDISDLEKISSCNIFKGKKLDEGYSYLPDAKISIQGINSNDAWRNILIIMKKIQLPVTVVYKWRQNDQAIHPGREASLSWKP